MPTITQLSKYDRKVRRYKNKRPDLRGCPQKKGTCVKVFEMTPRKPNSALRKVARVVFRRWKRKVLVYIPGECNGQPALQKHSVVLVRGGRVADLPGMKYTIIRGKFDLRRLEFKRAARSKYGMVKTYTKVDHRYKKFLYN